MPNFLKSLDPELTSSCYIVFVMATQNIAPSSRSSSQKGGGCPRTGQGDGQSVSKRLQQDLMTLMVCKMLIR